MTRKVHLCIRSQLGNSSGNTKNARNNPLTMCSFSIRQFVQLHIGLDNFPDPMPLFSPNIILMPLGLGWGLLSTHQHCSALKALVRKPTKTCSFSDYVHVQNKKEKTLQFAYLCGFLGVFADYLCTFVFFCIRFVCGLKQLGINTLHLSVGLCDHA